LNILVASPRVNKLLPSKVSASSSPNHRRKLAVHRPGYTSVHNSSA
jgi:hypothetical protein